MSVMVQQTGDAGVNWVHIDNELHRIPPEYQQVKFDSLRHVVAILSSIDPERHLQQLKEQLARTEKLVDRVVEGYHNGFNKAIQNYSRILQLFATAAEQVRRLKRSLEESRRCLCAQSHHLTTQWQKNVVLTQTVRMLEDISVLKDAPAQVDALIRKQDWKLAVKTLMEAGQKLSQPDLRRVGALSRVQSALQARHAQLAKRLLVEIDRRVFYGHAASPAAAKLLRDALQSYQQLLQPAEPEARGDDAEAPADLTLLVQCLSQMGSLSHLKASLASNLRGEIHGAVLRAFHAFLDLSGGKVVTEAGAAAAAAAARPAAQESWQPAALALVADTVPPKVGDRARGCIRVVLLHSALVLRELMELLRCIEAEDGALLGRSGSTGGMALLQQLEALDAVPELGSEADGDGRSTASEAVRGPFSRSTEAAHIWCSIQAELQQVLGVLLHAPLRQASDGVGDGQRGGAGGGGTGGAGGVTAGLLEVPSSSHSDGRHAGDGGSVVSAMTGMLPGASDSASLGSWLSSLYRRARGDAAGGDAAEEGAAMPASPLLTLGRSKNLPPSGPGAAASALISSLASAPRPSSVPNKWSRRGGRLCFTFDGLLDDLGVEDMLPEAEMGILDRRDSEADLQLLVPRVLGGHPGSPYLTMAVYREVVQFVSCAAQLLPEGVRDGGGGGGLGGRKARAAAQPVLRQALEDFISTTLLPKVWVDFRAKSNDLLEGPEAFQLPSHLKVQLQLASRTGRAVLLSALTLEHMVGELMRWAAAMPLFAPHLTGVVENLLGRFLDAFQGKLAAMASETLTCSLASKADVAGVMMREPSAALLQHCVAFYTPRPGQQFDAASHAAASAKLLASGGSQTEQAMVQLLLKELPKDASGSGLLSNSQTSAALATLALMADSLDYVAEAIALLASGTPPPADGGEAAAASSTARRTSRGYRPSRGPSGRPEDRISSTGVVCFTGGLCMLHDRAKMLAGQCLRMLRLELSLLVLQNLSLLMSRPASGAAAGRSDGREESELFAGGLVRRVVRLEADLGKHLTPDLHLYVFGSLAGFAARALRLLVAGIPSITGHGIEHLMRALSILQQGLKVRGIRSASGATGLPGPASRSEAGDSGRQFDNTRTYLSLLKRPAEELIRLARKQPFRYMPAEWTALLQVDVQGRVVLPGHKDQLAQVLQGRKAQEASKLSSTAKFFSMPP